MPIMTCCVDNNANNNTLFLTIIQRIYVTLEKCTSTQDALHTSNTELLYIIVDQMHILRFQMNTVKLRFYIL